MEAIFPPGNGGPMRNSGGVFVVVREPGDLAEALAAFERGQAL